MRNLSFLGAPYFMSWGQLVHSPLPILARISALWKAFLTKPSRRSHACPTVCDAVSGFAVEYISLCPLHEATCDRLIKVWVVNEIKRRGASLGCKTIRKDMNALCYRPFGFHQTRRSGNGQQVLVWSKRLVRVTYISGATNI